MWNGIAIASFRIIVNICETVKEIEKSLIQSFMDLDILQYGNTEFFKEITFSKIYPHHSFLPKSLIAIL